ncbi:MAG: ornithine cyclodeaminase family protein, partial [Dermatophilaceae bacterium]
SLTRLLTLSAQDVHLVLDEPTALESQRQAFRALGLGHAQQPARILMEGPDNSSTFCYAARVDADSGAVCKFGSVMPGNVSRGLPSISAVIVVLDPETGSPAALVDGTSVTTIRTSAASAVAAENLAQPGSSVLAVIGCGVQAEAHIRLMRHVLPLREVRVFGRDREGAAHLATRLREELDLDVRATQTAAEAISGAQVVVTVTSSRTPVFDHSDLEPGATVISVGSYAAERCEVPRETVVAAESVVVDHRDVASEHAGPIVQAIAEGALDLDDVLELGEVMLGRHPVRRTRTGIVYYNSVGVGVQDAAAATLLVARARELGLGQTVEL